MLNSLERFEFCLAGVEKTFNILACVPFICEFSGNARLALGKLQVITGVAIGILAFLAKELSLDAAKRKKFQSIADRAIEHILHGFANIARGILETIPFIGIVLYLGYDLSGMRIRYYGEIKGEEWLSLQQTREKS